MTPAAVRDTGWMVGDWLNAIVLVALLVWLLPPLWLLVLAWVFGSFAVAVLWGSVVRFGEGEE